MNLPVDVFLSMIDDAVNVGIAQADVRTERIGVDIRSGFDLLADFSLQSGTMKPLLNGHAHTARAVAVGLQEPHDRDLTLPARPFDDARSRVSVHVARLAADEGLINFDVTAELVERLRLNREPQTKEHEPRGLLGDAKVAGNLVAADAVLAVHKHPHGRQPLGERNRAVLKNRADLDAELLAAFAALPDSTGRHERGVLRSAMRAGNAARPAKPSDEHCRYVNVAEVGDCAQKGVGSAALGSHK